MSRVVCPHPRIESLREQIATMEGVVCRAVGDRDTFSTRKAAISSGCPALDRLLPENGFRKGTLIEWIGAAEDGGGDGAATLAFRAAVEACRASGVIVVLDRSGEFYPPAAVRLGIEPARWVIVHPSSKSDHGWALDQALRCPAVAAVIAWPDAPLGNRPSERPSAKKPNGRLDSHTFRRLQLAVEQGGGVGMLIRPHAARRDPSWADVRLLVEPLADASPYGRSRRMRVEVLRCRGGRGEQTVEVEIDDETPAGPVG